MVQMKMYRGTIMGYSVISDAAGVQRAAVGGVDEEAHGDHAVVQFVQGVL